jgi:hypothetical protein
MRPLDEATETLKSWFGVRTHTAGGVGARRLAPA